MMKNNPNTVERIVTHSGQFHPDEVSAILFLLYLFPKATIVRTRDKQVLTEALADLKTIVADIGGINNFLMRNHDHHQAGGAGSRDNAVPYSSSGLVWMHYGIEVCRLFTHGRYTEKMAHLPDADKLLWYSLDEMFVQGIDAVDSGALQNPNFTPKITGSETRVLVADFNQAIFNLNPQPLLTDGTPDFDAAFMMAIDLCRELFEGYVAVAAAQILGEDLIKQGRRELEQIVVVDHKVPNWSEVVSDPENGFPEALYYIEPDDSEEGAYVLWQVPISPNSFVGRKPLPAAWAGKRDEDLLAVCGIEDANFCHDLRFCGGGYTLEATIAMAKAAISYQEPTPRKNTCIKLFKDALLSSCRSLFPRLG